jgi:predicted transcriptional regulator
MAKQDRNGTSFRLNELKAPLQQWAMELDRSTNYLLRKILEEAIIKKFNYPADHFIKLREQRKAG